MIKIIKFAGKSWYVMIFIILLLIVQVSCELSLPQYTSDIVDVGIQYGGIESPIPEVLRSSTMTGLLALMPEEEGNAVLAEYERKDKESLSQEDYVKLRDRYPVIGEEPLYFLRKDGLTKDEVQARTDRIYDSLVKAEAVTLMLRNGQSVLNDGSSQKELTAMSETMLKSMAISFVQDEYTQIGMNLNHLQTSYLKSVGVRMLLLAFLGMLAAVAVGFLSAKLAAKTSHDLRNQIFKKVVGFSNGEMNQFSTASLITRSTNDVQQVQQVLVMIFRMVAYAPIMGIGGIIKVLHTDTSMTWIIAVAVGLILVVVLILMVVAMPKFKTMQKLVDRLNLVSREILTGIPVIRAFSREQHEEKRFEEASRDLMKTQLFTNRAMTFMMPAMMFIMNGITVLIIWVGAQGIDMGNIQVGDMMAFITYTMQIVMSFLVITMVSIMLPRAAVAADRIDEVLKSETLIKNPEEPAALPESGRGRVTFDHVSFRYPQAEEDVLEDISFTANPGETTAIIGSTGCGKSTLVQLLPRLFDVTGGKITIDGTDIRNLDMKELRAEIGFVPQKGILFSGTIESNLRFGAKEASEQVIFEAARIAQAEEFISSKPEGYETPISQGGSNVSGGQKQRLSIARAIAKNPKIYVFDDSFSALDYKTDIALRRALKDKVSDAVVIIVAQRISTIIHAEKIIVLDDGRMAGMGTHEELLASNEVYRQIAASQLSREELEGRREG